MPASPKLNLSFCTWRDSTLLMAAYLVAPASPPFWVLLIMIAALFIEPAGEAETSLKGATRRAAIRLGSVSFIGLACAYFFTTSALALVTIDVIWWLSVAVATVITGASIRADEADSAQPRTRAGVPNGFFVPVNAWGESFFESTTLVIGLIYAWRFWPGLWSNGRGLVIASLVFVGINWALRGSSFTRRYWISLSATLAALMGGVLLSGNPITAAYFGPILFVIFLSLSQLIIGRIASVEKHPAEGFRLAAILAITFWIYQPIAYSVLHGTGDALWYSTVLADMLEQIHHGVFPVWAGQSIYQFNGAIYPLRIAPAFHYIGALFDLLTLHSLNAIGVQNLMLVTWALFAGLATYLCLTDLMRGSRGFALLLAILFIACPGVMSVVYYTDLYMSWMTIPFLPIVLYLSIKTFSEPTKLQTIGLGLTLGLMWWGHSPMALWTTLIAGATQVFRLLFINRKFKDWFMMLPAALVFGAVAVYPLTSVLLFPPEAGVNAAGFQRATAANIAFFVRSVFPDVMLPIKNSGLSLSCFQLGYSLWIIWLVTGALIWKSVRQTSRLFYGFAFILAILLIPIPHLNEPLWSLVPNIIRDTTGNWVMNRLYAILAGTTIFSAGAFWADWEHKISLNIKSALGLILVLFCGWSLSEGSKFGVDAAQKLRPKESATQLLLPENAVITRFAYLVFPTLPAYFSHGVVDPELETRLFSEDGRLKWSNADAIIDAWKNHDPRTETITVSSFAAVDPSAAVWALADELVLRPDQHYLALFDYPATGMPPGVMQFIGGGLFREYELPVSGGAKAFGSGPESAHYVPVWNTQPKETRVAVKYIVTKRDAPADLGRLRLTLIRYDRAVLPATVTSWIPYKLHLSAATDGWLETPRSFHTDFLSANQPATIRKSVNDLVMVHVTAETRDITLESNPPWAQKALFWISFLAVLSAVGYCVASLYINGLNAHTALKD